MSADFYTYRKEVAAKRRRKRIVLLLLAVAVLVCAVAGWLWLDQQKNPTMYAVSAVVRGERAEAGAMEAQPSAEAIPEPAPAATEPTQPPAATPETAAVPATLEPQRILPAIDAAAWDHAEPVAQTINLEYLNTDHRMIGVPMLGTVTRDYFGTVTFVGDSIASGLGIYDAGYRNAKYCTYNGATPNSFVNNVKMLNAVTKVEETPMEAIVATQPDYVYLLLGTNSLVSQNSEEGMLAYYQRLIEQLREQLDPGVIFYIQAVPGVQEDVVTRKPGLENGRISVVNDLLANLALRTGCYFVNVREVLTNADGCLIDAYDANYDGVHFNPTGYREWARYLATHTVWNRRSLYTGENPYYIYGA